MALTAWRARPRLEMPALAAPLREASGGSGSVQQPFRPGVTIASTVTHLLGVVAIVLGIAVLGGSITVTVLGGIVLVLIGVGGLTRRRAKPGGPAHRAGRPGGKGHPAGRADGRAGVRRGRGWPGGRGEDADAAALRELSFAAGGRAALKGALKAALRLGHNYVGTEHLLPGVLFGDGDTGQALATLGLDAETAERLLGIEFEEMRARRQAAASGH